MNAILANISKGAWPKDKEEGMVKIAHNNWTLKLNYQDGRRSADLKHRNNDHTAWVIEHSKKKGVFVNFDIGGS